jgi:Domain of unknown function (DUF6379)
MGPLDKYILSEDALKATKNGFELSFQTHWYRSLPLSCMDFNLIIDGKVIDKKVLKVKVNDKSFKYEQLPNLDNEWLFVLDKGILQFESGDALVKDKLYGVEFKYDLYIPYILVGPQANPLLASSVIHKNLICQ